MSDKLPKLNASAKSLKERAAVVEGLFWQIDYQSIKDYALNYKRWIIQNLPAELALDSLNWKYLRLDARKAHIRSMVYFLAQYQSPPHLVKGVSFEPFCKECEIAFGAYSAGWFTFYDILLEQNDFNQVMLTLSHEMIHLFQDLYKTSLSKTIINESRQNYVFPYESEAINKKNPLEVEAFESEIIIGGHFLQALLNR